MRKTKIIFTIGPSCQKRNVLIKMLSAGGDGVRINFSHGTLEEKSKVIKIIRGYEQRTRQFITIIGDLQGSSIRIGEIGKLEVKYNEKYRFSYRDGGIPLRYEEVYRTVKVGDIILVDDGRVKFEVVEKGNLSFVARALNDGVLSSKKTFLIKNKDIDLPSITDKDIKDLKFSIKHRLDYIALSFVKDEEDIKALNSLISRFGGNQGILAKVERLHAVENINNIINACDGIIIARGDLGLYYDLENIPRVQVNLVRRGVLKGKITILATQILETLRYEPTPTRSEVTDIYKAVEERVDAIMLTGETAVGKYPILAVEWAVKILESADKLSKPIYKGEDETVYDKFAKGVLMLAEAIGGKIIGYSKSGNTAMRVSRYRPTNIAYIVVNDDVIARKINIRYGIVPLLSKAKGIEKGLSRSVKSLIRKGTFSRGDIIIYMYGVGRETTDVVRVEEI